MDNFWEINLIALKASNQLLICSWLETNILVSHEYYLNKNGFPILSINGQSQASPINPEKEAGNYFLKYSNLLAGQKSCWFFGLSNIWIIKKILDEGFIVNVYEPNLWVMKKVLEFYNLEQYISSGNLVLKCPWHLYENNIQSQQVLLIHQASARRAEAQLVNLRHYLYSPKADLSHLNNKQLKIMIIPPFSGGPLTTAYALESCGNALGHNCKLLYWDNAIMSLVEKLKVEQNISNYSNLFKLAEDHTFKNFQLFQPDLVIALAQAPLKPLFIERLKQIYPAIFAFWFIEDFQVFKYLSDVAPAYDLFLHIQGAYIDNYLKQLGVNRAFYLPLAANNYSQINEINSLYSADLSFMGAGYPNRQAIFERLAENFWPKLKRDDRRFKIFGSGWEDSSKAIKKHLFQNGQRIAIDQCPLIYKASLINLNIHSSISPEIALNPSSAFVNPRTFEIASVGAFQLTDFRPLMAELFKVGDELIEFYNEKEMYDLIEFYLSKPELAADIASKAQKKVLNQHLYRHRLESILSILNYKN